MPSAQPQPVNGPHRLRVVGEFAGPANIPRVLTIDGTPWRLSILDDAELARLEQWERDEYSPYSPGGGIHFRLSQA